MTYWLKINGESQGPFTEHEIFRKFDGRLTRYTPCSAVGTNTWKTIEYYFPDWENPGIMQHDPVPKAGAPEKPSTRYPALAFYRIVFRILALLALVYGFIRILFTLSSTSRPEGAGVVIVDLIETFFEVIINLAFAEVITILFDIEQNTRKPAAQQTTPSSPQPPPDFA
ncbi:MAG: hypothetical protein WCD79_11715 [Chthoniobacteraceae bacterium]